MLKYKLSQIDSITKKVLSKLSNTDCIFLYGELGSGKTTFTRSLINGFQAKYKVAKTEVPSPTFNLLYEYEIKSIKIMHYDLYRLADKKEVDQLGIFENTKNVIKIVEWPEKIKKIIENRLEITFSYEININDRNLKFNGFGKWKNFKLNEI